MKYLMAIPGLFFCVMFLAGCGEQEEGGEDNPGIPAPAVLSYRVVNTFPHDTMAFTQGLTFHDGVLYESTGSPDAPANNGTWIASVDLNTGKYERKIDLGRTYFGEGINFFNDRIYQLTYKTKRGFVYDAKTFEKIREFSYGSEGWGLTDDGKNLIMSTGTSNIYFVTPDSLEFVRTLPVQDNKGYVNNLNELEYIDGFIYANIWLTPTIVRIDPATGYVTAKLDLSKLEAEAKSRYADAQEMNGIAYDSTTNRTFVTGKKWPLVYEIKW